MLCAGILILLVFGTALRAGASLRRTHLSAPGRAGPATPPSLS